MGIRAVVIIFYVFLHYLGSFVIPVFKKIWFREKALVTGSLYQFLIFHIELVFKKTVLIYFSTKHFYKEKSMKRVLARDKQGNARIKSLKQRLQEEKRSEVDLEALKEVQKQFDCLIEQMMSAKVLLAGLAIGANEVSVDSDVDITSQEQTY
jgi:hypothetical protein